MLSLNMRKVNVNLGVRPLFPTMGQDISLYINHLLSLRGLPPARVFRFAASFRK